MGFLIGFRFGHLGANPVEASGQTRATSEKDPRSKKQEKDQRSQRRNLLEPACSKHTQIYPDLSSLCSELEKKCISLLIDFATLGVILVFPFFIVRNDAQLVSHTGAKVRTN